MSTQLLTNPTAKPPEPPPPDPPRITEEEAALQKADARIKALEDEVEALKAEAKAEVNNESINEMPNAKESAKHSAWQTFEASAYTADCPEGCSGVTATGIDVTGTIYHAGKRIIAVDPSVIALGSTVEIKQADGTTIEAMAQDTGGYIKGAKIDVLVARETDAVQFGRQSVQVRVIN
ncbi:3D domain-containing protein [Bacillus subtilis]|uniref:3D domain-containing protein n=1 Tax=Bacillus subtilis TaxID=1423 RepID=UPI0018A727ED|nr:3D domain-containing protein [Bacillus subtilis]MBG9809140.1 SPBc2 prophage-derived protein YorM [Bacillus subtilis]QPG30446.1 3D domain-containing protein [Bacillus subtilis]QTM25129.1 3D domain-containing protein [Bacillus subtilis]ULN55653.1 3D domain-containing protein [Bacillus subtilis]WOA21238.1 3D domain-containing protein [Bacillus subtilis]